MFSQANFTLYSLPLFLITTQLLWFVFFFFSFFCVDTWKFGLFLQNKLAESTTSVCSANSLEEAECSPLFI